MTSQSRSPQIGFSWLWRVYQSAVVLFFLFAEIHWEWGIGSLAAGVIGGMVAWYSSVVIGRVLWRMGLGPLFGLEGAPVIDFLYRPPAGQPEPLSERPELEHRP